ncbi:hypothetical protein TNCV_4649381 [Trichonephila clavipes]|uniref:Uncharacterized protein n=1 Tax=Trichonephila clavipes TaxID=2585209 RepID=A0A8X6SY54_TRICX|nr:hypothetical protein TNCV_4649381 [Trichonephila clavipes]
MPGQAGSILWHEDFWMPASLNKLIELTPSDHYSRKFRFSSCVSKHDQISDRPTLLEITLCMQVRAFGRFRRLHTTPPFSLARAPFWNFRVRFCLSERDEVIFCVVGRESASVEERLEDAERL